MVIRSNYVLQKNLINFTSIMEWSNKKSKNVENKNEKQCNISGPKTPKNDLLTSNYGLSSSFKHVKD